MKSLDKKRKLTYSGNVISRYVLIAGAAWFTMDVFIEDDFVGVALRLLFGFGAIFLLLLDIFCYRKIAFDEEHLYIRKYILNRGRVDVITYDDIISITSSGSFPSTYSYLKYYASNPREVVTVKINYRDSGWYAFHKQMMKKQLNEKIFPDSIKWR